MSRDQYKRAYAGDTPRAATVALALDAAVARLTVLVNGTAEERSVSHVDASTGRSVPVLADGERVLFGIDGSTHIAKESTT